MRFSRFLDRNGVRLPGGIGGIAAGSEADERSVARIVRIEGLQMAAPQRTLPEGIPPSPVPHAGERFHRSLEFPPLPHFEKIEVEKIFGMLLARGGGLIRAVPPGEKFPPRRVRRVDRVQKRLAHIGRLGRRGAPRARAGGRQGDSLDDAAGRGGGLFPAGSKRSRREEELSLRAARFDQFERDVERPFDLPDRNGKFDLRVRRGMFERFSFGPDRPAFAGRPQNRQKFAPPRPFGKAADRNADQEGFPLLKDHRRTGGKERLAVPPDVLHRHGDQISGGAFDHQVVPGVVEGNAQRRAAHFVQRKGLRKGLGPFGRVEREGKAARRRGGNRHLRAAERRGLGRGNRDRLSVFGRIERHRGARFGAERSQTGKRPVFDAEFPLPLLRGIARPAEIHARRRQRRGGLGIGGAQRDGADSGGGRRAEEEKKEAV